MLDNVDIQTFKAIKLPNNMIYFGQIGYCYSNQTYFNKEEVNIFNQAPVELQDRLKKVRHGYGVEIQLNDNHQQIYKYEGYWVNDIKQKQAKIIFEKNCSFEGEISGKIYILDGKFQGYGSYVFSNGAYYDGTWENNRLQGGGKLVTAENKTLQGIFQNNYLHVNENFYLNPFMPQHEMNDFIKNKNYINKIKESNYNKKLFQFKKIYQMDELKNFFQISQSNSRIPIVLSSKQQIIQLRLLMGKKQFYQLIQQSLNKKLKEFDFRKASQSDNLQNFMNQVKQDLAFCLIKGHIFTINIDDSEVKYPSFKFQKDLSDPDISQFYDQSKFPQQFWNLNNLFSFGVFNKILSGTEFKKETKVSDQFQPMIWSKFKIDQNLPINRILEKYESRFIILYRFQCIIPVKKFDLAILCEKEDKQ